MADYRPSPIADHALTGDLQTAAFVVTDGSINRFCDPRFSPLWSSPPDLTTLPAVSQRLPDGLDRVALAPSYGRGRPSSS